MKHAIEALEYSIFHWGEAIKRERENITGHERSIEYSQERIQECIERIEEANKAIEDLDTAINVLKIVTHE